jgi:hypothetical protein
MRQKSQLEDNWETRVMKKNWEKERLWRGFGEGEAKGVRDH